jgi:hypothetical protein
LLSAKKDVPYHIYYKKDTHWNELGGFIAFDALVKKFQSIGLGGYTSVLRDDMISEAGLVGQDMHPTDKDMSYNVAFLPEKT